MENFWWGLNLTALLPLEVYNLFGRIRKSENSKIKRITLTRLICLQWNWSKSQFVRLVLYLTTLWSTTTFQWVGTNYNLVVIHRGEIVNYQMIQLLQFLSVTKTQFFAIISGKKKCFKSKQSRSSIPKTVTKDSKVEDLENGVNMLEPG